MAVAAIESMVGSGEAARRLGVSTQYLGQLAAEGRIAFVATPIGRLFDPVEVERVRQERQSARREAA